MDYINSSQKSGIVDIFDLPHDITYVKLNEDYKLLIFNFIKNKFITINNFARKLGLAISRNNSCDLLRSIKRGGYARLSLMVKIIAFLKKELPTSFNKTMFRNNILGVKCNNGKQIKYPKFPINFNCKDGGIIVAAFLGDGGMTKKDFSFFYSNTQKCLLERVKKAFEKLVGQANPYERLNEISYPKIVGILLIILGFIPGQKTINNQRISPFVVNSSISFKRSFISQIIADEGYVYLPKKERISGLISFNFTIDLSKYDSKLREINRISKKLVPEILLTLITILKSLNINVRGPYFKVGWLYANGRYCEEWSCCIIDIKSLKIIYKDAPIPLDYKQGNLESIIRIKELKRSTKVNV